MAMPQLQNRDLDLPAMTTLLGYCESEIAAFRLNV